MLSRIVIYSCVLVAATVAVHAVGLTMLALGRSRTLRPMRFWPTAWLLIQLTWSLILIHVVEISVWGAFYVWQGCLPDAESAFYFAGVTYTTLGYGDLVLPAPWRMLGPIQSLTGILMCGLSTGFFFAIVSKVVLPRTGTQENP